MGKAEVEAFLTHLALDRDVAAALRTWLAAHPEDRTGAKGTIRKSNRTDNASAKVATSKGVIQGYTGVAAVDAQHQIIVEAQAHGTGSEQELLLPMVKATAAYRNDQTLITADAGYHSDTNLTALAAQEIPALIADTGMRQRDERFADQDKYKALPDPLYDEVHPKQGAKHYRPKDTMARNQRSRSAKCALTPVQHAPQFSSETVIDEVVGQERRSQESSKLSAFTNNAAPWSRAFSFPHPMHRG
jgi:hypothetical protein